MILTRKKRLTKAKLERLRKDKAIVQGISCPACKFEQARVLRIGISEDPKWPVYQCLHCRLQFIEPYYKDLKDYYRTDYRKSHTDTFGHNGKEAEVKETPEHRFVIQQLASKESAKLFMQHVPEGASVLEIGPSAGGFLSHLVGKYDLHAVEWNSDDAKYVREVGEIPCEECNVEDAFPDKKFTAIVARQVLEHTADPYLFLDTCRRKLIGGGWLFLELPNANNALAAVYGIPSFQDWWFSAPHLTYWEPETLMNILDATGFEARVKMIQRFGLAHAMNWILKGFGITDEDAEAPIKPVSPKHPLAPALNRIFARMDKEYRVQMETLGCTDQLRVITRRSEI